MNNSNYKIENIEKKYLNVWYDWLINFISEPMRKNVNTFTYNIVSLFKTNAPQDFG